MYGFTGQNHFWLNCYLNTRLGRDQRMKYATLSFMIIEVTLLHRFQPKPIYFGSILAINYKLSLVKRQAPIFSMPHASQSQAQCSRLYFTTKLSRPHKNLR